MALYTINFQVPVSVWLAELFISVCLDLSISVTVSLFCDNYLWQISVLPIILLLQPDGDFLSPLILSRVQLMTINSYSNSVGQIYQINCQSQHNFSFNEKASKEIRRKFLYLRWMDKLIYWIGKICKYFFLYPWLQNGLDYEVCIFLNIVGPDTWTDELH